MPCKRSECGSKANYDRDFLRDLRQPEYIHVLVTSFHDSRSPVRAREISGNFGHWNCVILSLGAGNTISPGSAGSLPWRWTGSSCRRGRVLRCRSFVPGLF